MAPYQTAKCLCGCGNVVVLEIVGHTFVAASPDSWAAARIASALNRHHCPPAGDALVCDSCGLPVVTFGAAA